MFGPDIKFKYPWRPYQQRVLDEIQLHLEDDKLHIIAPPGSGKTVLGLEVVRYLNSPTLILSPTITIRNQWIDRFVELFTDGGYSDYTYDLREAKFITSSTYQSLYAGLSETLMAQIQSKGIEVLVLDEAHHLKAEWWKSLTALTKTLCNVRIVALTATPPYDSSPVEWDRYSELCGPVDAEISIPELVKEGNLCPHQDLVYQSIPTKEEYDRIDAFYGSIDELLKIAMESEELETLLAGHPSVLEPAAMEERIYGDIEYFASIAVFLHYKRRDCGKLIRHLGLKGSPVPTLNDQWLEILFTGLFFKDRNGMDHAAVKELKKVFRKYGAVEKKRIILTRQEGLNKMMGSSLSKFNSIRDIIDIEYREMQAGLRLLVLSDFVRKEALNQESEMTKFGVIPIMRHLFDTNTQSEFDYSDRVVGLSASLCVIPRSMESRVAALGEKQGLSASLAFKAVSAMPGFSMIQLPRAQSHKIVAIITGLFARGELNILIATKSLLGEGWDCPSVNSLVLATFVSSYMLSNQMRGRAIRTNRDDPHKTSNIWHLLCRDVRHRDNDSERQSISKRFKTFVGLDGQRDIICNGLERLGLTAEGDIKRDNSLMLSRAADRDGLYGRWFSSISIQGAGKIVKTVKSHTKSLQRSYIYNNTLKYLIAQGLISSMGYTFHYLQTSLLTVGIQGAPELYNVLNVLKYGAVIGAAGFLLPTVKAVILLLRHGSGASSLRQIGMAVLATLKELDGVCVDEQIRMECYKQNDGSIFCELRNSSPYEQSLFIAALREILDPIENPRYILTRKGSRYGKSHDFHAVPTLFGGKKERAEAFYGNWKYYMGASTLIYTRNGKGRSILVQARTNSLASALAKNCEVIDSWKC